MYNFKNEVHKCIIKNEVLNNNIKDREKLCEKLNSINLLFESKEEEETSKKNTEIIVDEVLTEVGIKQLAEQILSETK